MICFWKGDDKRSLIMQNMQNTKNMPNMEVQKSKISESELNINSRTCLGHLVLFNIYYNVWEKSAGITKNTYLSTHSPIISERFQIGKISLVVFDGSLFTPHRRRRSHFDEIFCFRIWLASPPCGRVDLLYSPASGSTDKMGSFIKQQDFSCVLTYLNHSLIF